MDSSEIPYINHGRAHTRLGLGPDGWFLLLDDTGEYRLLAEGDIERIVSAATLLSKPLSTAR